MPTTPPLPNDTSRFSAKEMKEIYSLYRRVIRPIGYYQWLTHGLKVRKAFKIASEAHNGVRRQSGEPYILHPLAVAEILVYEMGIVDIDAIIGAFLHDVVEDTDMTLDDMERSFGATVRNIIDGLTKMSILVVDDTQTTEQAENFRRIFLTLYDDIRIILIKLADRLHNMRTLGAKTQEKAYKITSETLYLYAPMAHRLGLYNIKSELEDLSLKYSQPDVYLDIAQKMQAFKENADEYIRNFIAEITLQLTPLDLKFSVKSRFKSVYSVYTKIVEKKVPFEDIFDLYAIRIIIKGNFANESTECWAVYSQITSKFLPNMTRIRDWVTTPKENGYESLHVTVKGPEGKWVEVQIRTERMDESAEKGVAAHWRYKGGGNVEDEVLSTWLAKVRDILENPELGALEAVQGFRKQLQLHNVYVFSPKGKQFRLPTGATALDFAYMVHTEVGNTALAAKVNNTTQSIDYVLSPGDHIQILTSTKQMVQSSWLQIATTDRARDAIKEVLRKKYHKDVRRGKTIFRWKARQYGVDEHHPYFQELLAYFLIATPDEFFARVGSGIIDAQKAEKFISLKQSGGTVGAELLDRWEQQQHKMRERIQELGVKADDLVVADNKNIDNYRLAKCCNPVAGDTIIGIAAQGRVLIHRNDCPEALAMMAQNGKSIIRTKWAMHEGLSDVVFLSVIRVEGSDRQGMLIDLLKVISEKMHINIRKVSIESDDSAPGARAFEGLFYVYVQNTNEMNDVIARLKKVSGVLNAYRYDGADKIM